MRFVEVFDRSALKHIIKYENYYKSLMDCNEDEEYAQFDLYKKYLKKACGPDKNMVVVNYKKKYGRGRLFAGGALSLQSFNKRVRGTLAKDYYYDVDMVNCHPVILNHICNQHDMFCYNLKMYVDNRNGILKNLHKINEELTIGDIKQAILSTIYGGKGLKDINNNDWSSNFIREIESIHSKVPEWFPKSYNDQIKFKGFEYHNLIGSTLSAEMCIIENDILMNVVDYCKNNKLIKCIAVLVFDGLMIQKTDKLSIDKINENILKIEQEIYNKMCIPMKFKVKEFDTLSMDVPYEFLNIDDENEEILGLNDVKDLYRKDDNYYWKDFINYLKNNIHDSEDQLYDYFINNCNRVMFKIYAMDDHIIRKISRKNMYQFDKKIPSEVFKYCDISATGKLVIKKVSLKQMLEGGCISNVMRFNNLDFRPIGVTEDDFIEDEDLFNTFTNFQAKLVDEVDMSKIDIILNHIKKVWCSDNDEYYNYMLSWFKLIITNPSFKSKVAIVLKSTEKQIGKGILINDFLIPYVFGEQYSMSIAGLDTITCKFNQIMMNKLFINCDELSTIDGSYHQSFDVLKKRITDKTIKIEIKGGKSFVYPDYCNYIMCTNNDFTIRMEMGDCRYFVLDCSPCYKGDYGYYGELADNLTQESANHFITYISRLNTGLTDIRDIPMTTLKKDMMFNSLSNPLQFLSKTKNYANVKCYCNQEVYEFDEIEDFENYHDITSEECKVKDYWIKSGDLYKMYIEWCESNRIKCLSKIKFSRIIKPYITKKRSNGAYFNLKNISEKLDF